MVAASPPPAIAEFPAATTAWLRDYRSPSWRKPLRIDLRFLQALEHGPSLVDGFWSRYGRTNYSSRTLGGIASALVRWGEFCQETKPTLPDCASATPQLLRSFMAWLARKQITRGHTREMVSSVIECLSEGANLEAPESGDVLRGSKYDIFVACRDRGDRIGRCKALGDADWQRLLGAARDEAATTIGDYQPGDIPHGGIKLVPFVVLVAAYTGANPSPLMLFRRDSWKPEPVLEGYWRVSWRKDRARGNEQQSLVFAAKVADGMSLIELLDFVRRWTTPLVERIAEDCRNDLWLFERARQARSAGWAPTNFLRNEVPVWMEKKGLDLTLDRIRSSAALTLLRTGKDLTHVQSFLQHTDPRTTWNYVRSDVLHPIFNQTIATTQDRILGLVLPQARASAAMAMAAPASVKSKLVSGEWDLGTCACLDPYDSPVEGEIKGRLCRSFHACYTCPHAVWFREHLPLEVWKLRRFDSLRLADPAWSQKYGPTCEIIRRDILGSFSAPDRAWAEHEAAQFDSLPVLAANGVTV